MTTYEQLAQFYLHACQKAIAEYAGVVDALPLEKPKNYENPHLQPYYEQGFKLGKELLEKERMPV